VVARRAHNPKVGGSNPPFATRKASFEAFLFMYKVYILYSSTYNKIYIGYTSNLDARLLSHNELGTKGWTKKYRSWQLVYTEIFEIKNEALLREKELKGAKGREWIWMS
jgi:putative endonuclease